MNEHGVSSRWFTEANVKNFKGIVRSFHKKNNFFFFVIAIYQA